MIKLSWGQTAVLVAASLPMAVIGGAGGYATYVNMNNVLHRSESALGMVAAGEGATLICALVALAVTLMGQHTPGFVRFGMWAIPLLASVTGALLAPTTTERIVMAVTPLAMTAAGEGVAFVARRVVAFRTGVDIEQQRRSGLLLWHANRAANGSKLGKFLSNMAVWRLTKQFASTDPQTALQIGEIVRYRVAESSDANLSAVLNGTAKQPQHPAVAPASPAPALPPVAPPKAASEPLKPSVPEVDDEDGFDWIRQSLAEEEARVALDTPQILLLTGDEVATRLNVKPSTVRSWVKRGNLRVHDHDANGRNLFSPADVDEIEHERQA